VKGGVFGKQVADIRVDAEEIADGVLVLGAIEAAEDDFAAGEVGPGKGASERLEEAVALPGRRLFLLGRGHLPEADAIVDADPATEGFGVAEIRGDRGQVEPALGRPLEVAVGTVSAEEGLVGAGIEAGILRAECPQQK
jgi:hypothetical protein